ncbi:hypothetical protein HanIR_Chr10g0500841 [Helianthus annuus]|nr:hypothetical protein HanIR_Chr10g0500841 [Helianthus annuus]
MGSCLPVKAVKFIIMPAFIDTTTKLKRKSKMTFLSLRLAVSLQPFLAAKCNGVSPYLQSQHVIDQTLLPASETDQILLLFRRDK